MTKVRTWHLRLAVLLAWLAAAPGWAQAVAGSQLSGTVRDATGAAIPGADVTITKTDTEQVRSMRSAQDGSYAFPDLPVGPYELKVSLQGFNTFVQSGIVLQVSTNPVINVTLTMGKLGETVTVVGNAAMVE